MSKLVICEKPSVAKSIASVLGVTSRADGYFEGNGYGTLSSQAQHFLKMDFKG